MSATSSLVNRLQMPEFDPSKSYEGEFFKMHMKNAQLLEELDAHAGIKNDVMMKICRIQDFYDTEVKKFTANRREDGRKIVTRKTMAELKRDDCCPYPSCGKIYASEGSLNLHIKRKHNGGNKTDREKMAKYLLQCQIKGLPIIYPLKINLPPGIVEKVARQIEEVNNVPPYHNFNNAVIQALEDRITYNNEI